MVWNPNLLLETTYFATKEKGHFNVVKFFKQFYRIKKKGSCFVVRTPEERQKLNLQNKGYLMPIIQINDNIQLVRNEEFFIAPISI